MRINNVFSGRPQFYDRNAIAITTLFYQTAGVAPHVQTTRATYTVPTGRKAWLGAAVLTIYRATVAAPVGKVEASLSANGQLFSVVTANNAVGDSGSKLSSIGLPVPAGNVLSLITTDPSTGGTNDYELSLAGIEFDA